MGLIKKLAVIIVILIAVGAGVAALVILTWPPTPLIPSDEIHVGRTTYFECHETGAADAPQQRSKPSYFLKGYSRELNSEQSNPFQT